MTRVPSPPPRVLSPANVDSVAAPNKLHSVLTKANCGTQFWRTGVCCKLGKQVNMHVWQHCAGQPLSSNYSHSSSDQLPTSARESTATTNDHSMIVICVAYHTRRLHPFLRAGVPSAQGMTVLASEVHSAAGRAHLHRPAWRWRKVDDRRIIATAPLCLPSPLTEGSQFPCTL